MEMIEDLDAVRGIGILMVFFFHAVAFFRYDLQFLPPFLKLFIVAGHSGVTLLFVLSAFLLFQPYIKSLETGITPSWKKFYMRRVLRILPMYLLMVAASAIVLKNYTVSLQALNIAWGVQGRSLYPFSTAWWAVYAEIQFYIVLPVIGYFLITRKKGVLAAFLLGYITLYFFLFSGKMDFLGFNFSKMGLLHTFLGRGYIFIIGALASFIFILYAEKIKNLISKNTLISKAGDAIIILILLLLGILLWIVDSKGYWYMKPGIRIGIFLKRCCGVLLCWDCYFCP